MKKNQNLKLQVTEPARENDFMQGWLDKNRNFTKWEDMTPDHLNRAYKSLKGREFQAHNEMVMYANMADYVKQQAKERGIIVTEIKPKAVAGKFGNYFAQEKKVKN